MKDDYVLHFINNVINELQRDNDYGGESFIIAADCYEIGKTFHIH